jgi:hypothetical protein
MRSTGTPVLREEVNQLHEAKVALHRNVLTQATRRYLAAARQNLPRRIGASGVWLRAFVARLARLERRRRRGRRCTRFNLTRKEQRCERSAQVDQIPAGARHWIEPGRRHLVREGCD